MNADTTVDVPGGSGVQVGQGSRWVRGPGGSGVQVGQGWPVTSSSLYIFRRLIHQGAVEKNPIMALYDKMKHFMTESERLKPGFLEVSNVIW